MSLAGGSASAAAAAGPGGFIWKPLKSTGGAVLPKSAAVGGGAGSLSVRITGADPTFAEGAAPGAAGTPGT